MIWTAASNRQILWNTAFVIIDNLDNAPSALNSFEHQLCKAIQVMRTESQINKRILSENLLAHSGLLHHTAADGNHQLRMCFFQLFQPYNITQRTPLSVIAYTTCVEYHKISLFAAFRRRHPHLRQHAFKRFAVMRIHLASVCNHTIGVRAILQCCEFPHPFFLLSNLFFRKFNSLSSFHSLLIPFIL